MGGNEKYIHKWCTSATDEVRKMADYTRYLCCKWNESEGYNSYTNYSRVFRVVLNLNYNCAFNTKINKI